MIKINKPNINYNDLLDACIGSMRESVVKKLFLDKKQIFIDSSRLYDSLGNKYNLEGFINHESLVTKDPEQRKELIKLYEKFKSNRDPVRFHDELMLLSERCLYCNIGIPESLDHYLPKSKFPLLSINPANLIPCCYSCNTRLNSVSSHGEALIVHPYFNKINSVYDEQWIFAKVPQDQLFFTDVKSKIISVIFYTDFNYMQVDDNTKKKLDFQFKHLIHYRYVVEAVTVLTSEISRLSSHAGTDNTLKHINKKQLLRKSERYPVNSYNNVIYKALSDSEMFLQTVEDKFV